MRGRNEGGKRNGRRRQGAGVGATGAAEAGRIVRAVNIRTPWSKVRLNHEAVNIQVFLITGLYRRLSIDHDVVATTGGPHRQIWCHRRARRRSSSTPRPSSPTGRPRSAPSSQLPSQDPATTPAPGKSSVTGPRVGPLGARRRRDDRPTTHTSATQPPPTAAARQRRMQRYR